MKTIIHFIIEGESVAEMHRRKKLTFGETPAFAEVGDTVQLPEPFKEAGQWSGTVLSRSFAYIEESVLLTYTLQKENGPYLSRFSDTTQTKSGADQQVSN